jgi:hypothetical protein
VSVPHEQAPFTQLAPAGHDALHPPQLFASFWVSTHAPLQSVRDGPESEVHDVEHAPLAHTIAAPSEVQTWPQVPQLFGSLWVDVQTPLQRVPSFAHWQTPL